MPSASSNAVPLVATWRKRRHALAVRGNLLVADSTYLPTYQVTGVAASLCPGYYGRKRILFLYCPRLRRHRTILRASSRDLCSRSYTGHRQFLLIMIAAC